MRVFVDTNVFVSGLLSKAGNSSAILRRLFAGDFHLVTSGRQMDELRRVLREAKVAKHTDLSAVESDAFVASLAVIADVVEIEGGVPSVCRDPDDDHHIAAAIAGRADLFVSGDKDLRDLGERAPIEIVTPSRFLGRLRPGGPLPTKSS